MQFYIVDAFTKEMFRGNPAGVVIYEDINEAQMQLLASELRFSETAFIRPLNSREFELRYFTPNSEVDLCGHATIASFAALLKTGFAEKNEVYKISTRAGVLPVYLYDDLIMMEQALPKVGSFIENLELLASILNIPACEIGDANFELKPQKVSTGLWDIILPIKSKSSLDKISPDFNRLSEYSSQYNVTGVHAFTLDSENCTAVCRNFAPLVGIDEEAATGTSNGALTYYLYQNKIIKDLNKNYIFRQGDSLKRPSEIIARLELEEDFKILVGGFCRIICEGKLNI